MSRVRRRQAAAFIASACGTLLIGSASASATPRWLDLGLLSADGQNAFEPHVAVDPAGDAVAVWERSNGTNTIVQAATRAAGAASPTNSVLGSFSAAVDISATGQDASDPQVAVDQAGDAVAVWERFDGANFIVQAATRPAGGSFSAPVDLSAPSQNAFAPQVAMDQAGDAVVVWQRSNGTSKIIQAATRPLGRPFTPAENLSAPSQDAFEPQVAMDQAGDAAVVWDRSNGANTIVQVASKPPRRNFSPPVDLSAVGQSASAPQVALDGLGDTTVVWARSDGTHTIVQAALRAVGGSFSAAVDLSAPGEDASVPEVAVDQVGDAVAVWQRSNGTNQIVQASTRSRGASFSAPIDLSAPGQNGTVPVVGVDPAGDAVVLWDHNFTIAFSARPAGGGFSAQTDITSAGSPELALDRTGDAVAVDVRHDSANFVVEGLGFDFAGPQLHNLSIPSSGAVGVPVTFSVAPLDVFSGAATGWIFGDGATAGGDRDRVSHTYTFPGTYQVTVTSTDGDGNTSTATGAVTISPSVLSGLSISPHRFSVAGRRQGGRCAKPNRANRSHRHCRRPIVLHVSYRLSSPTRVKFSLGPVHASFTDNGRAGKNRVSLLGTVDRRPLPPGSYQLTATPAGGTPHTASFTLIP